MLSSLQTVRQDGEMVETGSVSEGERRDNDPILT